MQVDDPPFDVVDPLVLAERLQAHRHFSRHTTEGALAPITRYGRERTDDESEQIGASSATWRRLAGWLVATVRGELIRFVQAGSSRQVRGTT